jgi:hypothetical protein
VATPIPDQIIAAGSPFSIDVANNFDNEHTDYFRQASGLPLPSWLTNDYESSVLTGTPAAANVGTIAIEVTARERLNFQTVIDTFNLTVTPAGSGAAASSHSAMPANTPSPTVTPAGSGAAAARRAGLETASAGVHLAELCGCHSAAGAAALERPLPTQTSTVPRHEHDLQARLVAPAVDSRPNLALSHPFKPSSVGTTLAAAVSQRSSRVGDAALMAWLSAQVDERSQHTSGDYGVDDERSQASDGKAVDAALDEISATPTALIKESFASFDRHHRS